MAAAVAVASLGGVARAQIGYAVGFGVRDITPTTQMVSRRATDGAVEKLGEPSLENRREREKMERGRVRESERKRSKETNGGGPERSTIETGLQPQRCQRNVNSRSHCRGPRLGQSEERPFKDAASESLLQGMDAGRRTESMGRDHEALQLTS